MQRIHNAIFTGVCKVSLQRKNKPGRNSTWISDFSINNQKQICQNINNLDSVSQDRERVQPSLFNQFKPKNKKVKLSWSNIKSDTSYNNEKRSNTKSTWSNIKLDASYKI